MIGALITRSVTAAARMAQPDVRYRRPDLAPQGQKAAINDAVHSDRALINHQQNQSSGQIYRFGHS